MVSIRSISGCIRNGKLKIDGIVEEILFGNHKFWVPCYTPEDEHDSNVSPTKKADFSVVMLVFFGESILVPVSLIKNCFHTVDGSDPAGQQLLATNRIVSINPCRDYRQAVPLLP